MNGSRFTRLLASAGALLSPAACPCRLCGQAARRFSPIQGICPSCYGQIPWIREVKCAVCGRHELCPDCRRRADRRFQLSRSAVRYDPLMKALLARYKYRGDEQLAEVLASMLEFAYRQLLYALAASTEGGKPGIDCLTYIPLSGTRLAERGFNQAEQAAVRLGRRVRLPVIPLLVRTRHTGKQSFKNRAERLSDMEGAFGCDDSGFTRLLSLNIKSTPLRIAIVDDVYTTGSTLDHCAGVINNRLSVTKEVSLYGLTWAR